MDAGNRTVFISSCTRRQMARRKPGRLRTQVLVAAIVLAVALGTFVAAGGGL